MGPAAAMETKTCRMQAVKRGVAKLPGEEIYTEQMGKSWNSPEKGNVDKMSEKCRKMSENVSKNCPEKGLKTQISDIFWTIFRYLVDAFVW